MEQGTKRTAEQLEKRAGTEAGAGDRPGRAEADSGAGAGAAQNGGSGAGAGAKAEKVVSELPYVSAPAPQTPKPAQKRSTSKPKAKKTKKADEPLGAEQLSALLLTLSGVVASRPGCEIWALTEDECNQIAKPLAAMVQESEKLSAVTQHSNAIALVLACTMIFVPRMFVFLSMRKAQKKPKQEVKQHGNQTQRSNARPVESGAAHDAPVNPVGGGAIGIPTVG